MRFRCDNCILPFSGPVVVRDHNQFCSAYCADRFQRKRELTVPQVSVLSAEDRGTIDEARRWFRRLLLEMQDSYLPGMEDGRVRHTVTLDGLERSGLYATLEKLNALAARHAGEPQLK